MNRTGKKSKPSRLLIVSHVVHYCHEGKLFAYGPYAREIDIWADLFPQLEIASPCRVAAPPGDAVAFTRRNIKILPQRETGGDTAKAKIVQIIMLPLLIWGLCRVMRRADAIHVRCPGNLGLLGVLLAPLFCRFRVSKYAGQWNGYAGERLAARLQRRLLRSRWWGTPVTVYGQWPGQPPHVHAFFTSMMTSDQVDHAIETADNKSITLPLRVLFSGRLDRRKRVHLLLEAIQLAVENGINLEVAIIGDGPEQAALEHQAAQLGIRKYVNFVGGVGFDEALSWYDWAHCLVLPSVTEGWPKVVAEAMCHGLICIAVKLGHVTAMLSQRGILLERGTPEEIADALRSIADDPAAFRAMTQMASHWARQYSLDGLRDALATLLAREWNIAPLEPKIQLVNDTEEAQVSAV